MSSLQEATLSLSYDSESINTHIQDFLNHLKNILEEDWADEVPTLDFNDPEYPEMFPLTINKVHAHAIVIEVISQGGYMANLAVCYTRTAVGQSFFFLIGKNARNDWQSIDYVLQMTWEDFNQLSKAAQYTALNC